VVFIFGPADLSSGIIRGLLRHVGKKKNNLIYLSGALRTPEAIELASGNNEIRIGNEEFLSKTEVFNVKFPDFALNLHADKHQIQKLVETVRPSNILLFHTTPRAMTPIRAQLSKIDHVQSTIALEEGSGPLTLWPRHSS
jgi:mRNA degradation ribonuclease J1/J2